VACSVGQELELFKQNEKMMMIQHNSKGK